MTRYESERNHSSTGNQTKRDDSLIAYGVSVRSYKQDSKHTVVHLFSFWNPCAFNSSYV
jgi:hypothetical protein